MFIWLALVCGCVRVWVCIRIHTGSHKVLVCKYHHAHQTTELGPLCLSSGEHENTGKRSWWSLPRICSAIAPPLRPYVHVLLQNLSGAGARHVATSQFLSGKLEDSLPVTLVGTRTSFTWSWFIWFHNETYIYLHSISLLIL